MGGQHRYHATIDDRHTSEKVREDRPVGQPVVSLEWRHVHDVRHILSYLVQAVQIGDVDVEHRIQKVEIGPEAGNIVPALLKRVGP